MTNKAALRALDGQLTDHALKLDSEEVAATAPTTIRPCGLDQIILFVNV